MVDVAIGLMDVNVGRPLDDSIDTNPTSFVQSRAWIDDRLDELRRACAAMHSAPHTCFVQGRPIILVAPECFFGYGMARMKQEWKAGNLGAKPPGNRSAHSPAARPSGRAGRAVRSLWRRLYR